MKSFFSTHKYVINCLKLALLLLCSFFLPKICITSKQHPNQKQINTQQFKLGIEAVDKGILHNITKQPHPTVVVVTNQTGVDQQGNKTVDLLLSKGFCINTIVVPQVQLAKAAEKLYSAQPSSPTISVTSLYKTNKKKQTLNLEAFKNAHAILFDMQDVGMRHYSYVATLMDTLDVAAQLQKPIIVLDRPNLLGNAIEGPMADSSFFRSTAHTAAIPTRYGMTIGELARYINHNVLAHSAPLTVVPMQNYERSHFSYELAQQLSPNLKSIGSCHGYSFLGLLGEVKPLDVGIGTEHAFQCIMLPENIKLSKAQWHELRNILKFYGIESKVHRYFSSRKKKLCEGLQIKINDINNFSSFNTLFAVLDFFKKSGVVLSYSPTFDKAFGTTKIRQCLGGKIKREQLEQEINNNIQTFFKNATHAFMYTPLPKIIEV